MKLTSKGTHPKICEEEKPEFPRDGLSTLKVIGKSIGILSILCPACGFRRTRGILHLFLVFGQTIHLFDFIFYIF